jgi:hypothetical protein
MKKLFIGFILGMLVAMSLSNKADNVGDIIELDRPNNSFVVEEEFEEFDCEPVDEYIYAMDGYLA